MLLVLALSATSAAIGAATTPTLIGTPIQSTRVSDGGEPLILADVNGKFLWIADTSGVYYSTDNGTRWQTTTGYTGDFGGAFTDGPGLAQDERGRLYKAVLHDNRGDVARSDDGIRFNQASYFAGYPIDRPWIQARGDTVVVVYLNNAGAIGTQEACARSTDAGATFVDRNPLAGQHGTGGLYMAPDKSFYFTGLDGIVTRHAQTCTDTTSVTGNTQNVLAATGVNNLIAMTGSGDALFVAGAGSGNKMMVAGIPKWGARSLTYTVSPSDLKTNTFGAVAARGGDVAVAWYGSTTSGDPSATDFTGTFDVYLALIRDYFGLTESGPTLQLWKVSEDPNHRGQICMGGVTCTGNRGLLDYFGVAFDKWGGLHVSYVDDTSATTTYHAHIVAEGAGAPIGEPPALPTGSAEPGAPTGTPGPGSSPVAKMKGDIQGLTLRLDASGSRGTPPLEFTWDTGDGTRLGGMSINHTYAQPGGYTVRLTVRDGAGREASTTAQVQATAAGSQGVEGGGGRSPSMGALITVLAVAALALALRRS